MTNFTPIYQYMIGSYGDSASRTGTISVSSSSTAVTGSGTSFTTELQAYDVIYAGGQTLFVLSVTDNTHLVLETAAGAALSGASFTYKRMTNVETMTNGVAPHHYFRPYYELRKLANGQDRGRGRPVAEWRFMFVARAFRDALRVFCPSVSNTVLIRTRTNDSADIYNSYIATISWPDETDKQAGRRLNFTLQYRNLRTA